MRCRGDRGAASPQLGSQDKLPSKTWDAADRLASTQRPDAIPRQLATNKQWQEPQQQPPQEQQQWQRPVNRRQQQQQLPQQSSQQQPPQEEQQWQRPVNRRQQQQQPPQQSSQQQPPSEQQQLQEQSSEFDSAQTADGAAAAPQSGPNLDAEPSILDDMMQISESDYWNEFTRKYDSSLRDASLTDTSSSSSSRRSNSSSGKADTFLQQPVASKPKRPGGRADLPGSFGKFADQKQALRVTPQQEARKKMYDSPKQQGRAAPDAGPHKNQWVSDSGGDELGELSFNSPGQSSWSTDGFDFGDMSLSGGNLQANSDRLPVESPKRAPSSLRQESSSETWSRTPKDTSRQVGNTDTSEGRSGGARGGRGPSSTEQSKRPDRGEQPRLDQGFYSPLPQQQRSNDTFWDDF